VGGSGRRQERWIFKGKGVGMHQAKLWAIQVFKLAKINIADVFIQHHRAVQPLTAIPRL